MRLTYNAEARVDRPEQIEELVRLAADVEIGLAIFEKTGEAPEVESEPHFALDRDRAARELDCADGAISVVNGYSDADELNALFEAAIEGGVISRRHGDARIHVYPLSIYEPDPILAVDPGQGPSLLGYSLKLREREGETPVAFTLRFLEEVVCEANQLLAR